MSIEEYNRISSKNVAQFVLNPQQYKPTVSDSDYQRGWIYRYFIRKVNDENAIIYEVSKSQFDIFSKFNTYVSVRIQWNITLPHTTENNDGAIEFNKKQIRKGMLLVSNLNIYFNNLLEYHREGGRASVGFLLPDGQIMRPDGMIVKEVENKIIGKIIK